MAETVTVAFPFTEQAAAACAKALPDPAINPKAYKCEVPDTQVTVSPVSVQVTVLELVTPLGAYRVRYGKRALVEE